jgi:hypothetical protein
MNAGNGFQFRSVTATGRYEFVHEQEQPESYSNGYQGRDGQA